MAITEKVRIVVDVVASGAKKELDSLKRGVNDAEGSFGKLKGLSSQATTFITENFATMGVAATTAVAAFAAKSIQAFQDLALQSGKFADATGATVEDASRLIEVFGDMGVEANTVQSALNKMNVVLGKGGEEIEALGLKGASTKETFLNVVDYLNSIEDPATRAREGTKLLGKSWTELSESVSGGADTLRASLEGVADTKVIDRQELANARSFRDSLDDLNDIVEDFTLSVGGKLVPALNGMVATAEKLGSIIDSLPDLPEPPGGWLDWTTALPGVGALTSGVNMAGDALEYFAGEGEKATDTTEDLGAAKEDAARAAEEHAAAVEYERQRMEEQREAAEQLEEGMRNLVDATLAAGSSTFAAADSFDTLLENMDAAKKATDDGATSVNEKEAADRKAMDSVLKYAAAESKAAEDTAKANNEQFGAKEAAQAQITALQRVKEKFPELSPIIDTYIAKLETASNPVTTPVKAEADLASVDRAMNQIASRVAAQASKIGKAVAGFGSGGVSGGGGGSFMSGGDVGADGYYTVGEQGRETVFLPRGAYVAPHNGAGPGARQYNITINLSPGVQPADVGRELVGAISAYERANGSSWRQ